MIKRNQLNSLIIMSTIASLAVGGFYFDFNLQKAEDSLLYSSTNETRLLISEENAFLPISEINLPEPEVVKELNVVVTAYSSTPWQTSGDPFVTASGKGVRDGIIANNLLPFGTKVKIPEIFGDKIFIVEDRMNSKKGYYHFDVWFSDYWEALNFGAERTYIQVLES